GRHRPGRRGRGSLRAAAAAAAGAGARRAGGAALDRARSGLSRARRERGGGLGWPGSCPVPAATTRSSGQDLRMTQAARARRPLARLAAGAAAAVLLLAGCTGTDPAPEGEESTGPAGSSPSESSYDGQALEEL